MWVHRHLVVPLSTSYFMIKQYRASDEACRGSSGGVYYEFVTVNFASWQWLLLVASLDLYRFATVLHVFLLLPPSLPLSLPLSLSLFVSLSLSLSSPPTFLLARVPLLPFPLICIFCGLDYKAASTKEPDRLEESGEPPRTETALQTGKTVALLHHFSFKAYFITFIQNWIFHLMITYARTSE